MLNICVGFAYAVELSPFNDEEHERVVNVLRALTLVAYFQVAITSQLYYIYRWWKLVSSEVARIMCVAVVVALSQGMHLDYTWTALLSTATMVATEVTLFLFAGRLFPGVSSFA